MNTQPVEVAGANEITFALFSFFFSMMVVFSIGIGIGIAIRILLRRRKQKKIATAVMNLENIKIHTFDKNGMPSMIEYTTIADDGTEKRIIKFL